MDVSGSFQELDTALVAIFEGSLAASAGMDLGLDHQQGFSLVEQLPGKGARLVGRLAHIARRHGHPVLPEQVSGLELMDVHFGLELARLKKACHRKATTNKLRP
jgi:hypothetical protein